VTRRSDAAPLLSIIVPAFDAAAHLDRALAGLDVVGGVEVVVVDDGSTDETAAIAARWAQRYPHRYRVVAQTNLGHGGAIMRGVDAARGTYVRVLDADDRLDVDALALLLEALRDLEDDGGADAVFTDFVYDREERSSRRARFDSVFPARRVFEWDQTRRFGRRQVLMMHAITYRTATLRSSGLDLPHHTFYVDSLFVVVPLAHVRRMYYLPLPLYRYRIGSAQQSIAPSTMVRRVEQQIRVNRLVIEALPDVSDVARVSIPQHLHRALLHYAAGVCLVTSATLARSGTVEHLAARAQFWEDLRATHPPLFRQLRRSVAGVGSNLPGAAGRRVTSLAYGVARRVVGFS